MNEIDGSWKEETSPSLKPAQVSSNSQVPKAINLALQGGGAHGAFTWGVLERLLEDDRVTIEGICGTSAGAMNGAMVAYGMMKGGRDGARAALETFWRKISDRALLSPLKPTWFDRMTGRGNMDYSPPYLAFDVLSRLWSPYQTNITGLNPLHDVLSNVVDFNQLRQCESPKLFVCATNVRTGKIKVFQPDEISVDALLASACLPFMFPAVEVDGEHYWDGGFMGNPAIFPLIYHCKSSDIVIVQINPIGCSRLPKTGREILNRMNEISFNSSLMREMRALAFVTKLLQEGAIPNAGRLRRIHVHLIGDEEVMTELGVSSKLNAEWEFLSYLRDVGRLRANAWLKNNFDKLGVESSIDVYEMSL